MEISQQGSLLQKLEKTVMCGKMRIEGKKPEMNSSFFFLSEKGGEFCDKSKGEKKAKGLIDRYAKE